MTPRQQVQENERGRLRRLIARMRALTLSVERRNERIWSDAEQRNPPGLTEDEMEDYERVERRQW